MNIIFKYYVRVVMFLFPISFLPMVVDPFGVGKNWLLMATAVIGLILWTISLVADKKSEIKTNKVLPWFAALVIWAWLGWAFRLPVGVKMRSVLDLGGVGTLTALLAWFWLWLQTESVEERKAQVNFLTAGGVLAVLTSIAVFLLPASKLPIAWPKDNPILNINQQWSLTGSLINEIVIGLFLVIEWGRRLFLKLKKSDAGYILEAGLTSFVGLGLMLSVFRLIRTGFVNLDGSTAWVIAAEVFKRSPIWGVGSGDFVEAFSAFRPAAYNLTKYWANGFKFSSMGGLQLWTELGLVGVAIAAVVALSILRQKKDFKFFRNVVMGLAVVLLPFNISAVFVMTWLLAMAVSETRKHQFVFRVGEKQMNVAPIVVAVVVLGVSAFSGYWLYRIVAGEMIMRSSLVAAAKNDGGTTYNKQIQAIGMLPHMAEYRRVYSQTNLALASTLLTKEDLSDDDKQKASVLIQQAVREAKAAISLEPNNSNYWLNLAAIYRQIVGVVDGAADWSFQAYQQAVALEPTNPVSKLEMGGLLYAANRFDEADRVFEQVVAAKNDYPNGWYNWAYTAKKMNKLADAVARLEQAVALVPVDSGDYDKASKELADWKKELDEAIKKSQESAGQQVQKQPETLTQPQALPSGTQEKVNVPTGELSPPKVTITPAPTVAPTTPTAAPTGTTAP